MSFIHFWIDTQMQNTQIGVDTGNTGIQIYNDIERFRAVEITINDCRYSATAGFVGFGCENVKISGSHLRGGLPAAHLRRRSGGLEMWPVEKIFTCEVSSVAGASCFTGCFWFQGAAGRNEKIKARSRRLRLCHRWVTLPSQKHAILTGPGADLERHQEGAKWYEVIWIEVIWNDPANNQKCNKKMKREVKVTTKKSKVTKTRLASTSNHM